MPDVKYPKNPNSDTAFVEEDGKRTRAIKVAVVDGTIDYPKNANSDSCYVTIDGKKQRALMVADVSGEGTVEYPNNPNSTKGYVEIDGKKQRVVLTASLAGGGTTPTGTITITENGEHDVTDYATADVQVPTSAPARYVKHTVSSGVLKQDGGTVPDLTGVTELGAHIFANAFQTASTLPASTTINFSNITSLNAYCLAGAFYQNTNLTGKITIGGTVNGYACEGAFEESGITEVEITEFPSGGANYAFRFAFKNCSNLTKVTISATELPASTGIFSEAFSGSAITTLDVSAVETIKGGSTGISVGHGVMFGHLTGITSVTWGSLTLIERNALSDMFNGSAITSMSFPAVTTSSFAHTQSLQNLLSGVANCTLHFPSNVQATVEALTGYSTTAPFSATSGTVLFDLPATE